MRVCAIQMTSTPDKTHNLNQAYNLMHQALDRGCQLVAFPENFSLMTDDPEQLVAEAETLRSPTVEALQEWAVENDLWIFAGSMPFKVSGRKQEGPAVTNTSLVISPDGEIVARYDKIHLFDVNLSKDRQYFESKNIKPGKKPVLVDLPIGKAGLSVCYDLRFPELYRHYSKNGAELLFIPSAFTALTGKAHWDVLTRARAVENFAYVIAPAQTGTPYPGRVVHGHTRIIDPWGRVIAERPAGPGIVWADIAPEEIARVRKEVPALRHRVLK